MQIESLQKELMDVYRLKREDEEGPHEHEELLIKRRDMLDKMSTDYQRVVDENKALLES